MTLSERIEERLETTPELPPNRRRLRRLGLLIPAFCLVPAALDGWQAYMQNRLAGDPEIPWSWIAFQSGEWLILGALTPLVYALATRYPLRSPHVWRNLGIHLSGALLLCVGWATMGIGLRALLGTLPTDTPLLRHYMSWLLTSLPWSVFVYFTVLGCVFAFAYFLEAKDREAVAARLSAQVAEARLGALRMQLHPHFLFNSLNAVAVLVRDGRNADATNVVEQLSEMLREVLGDEDSQEVTLAHELSFVRRYLGIEQMRFSDRLDVRWRIAPEAEDALVPSFLLQPLVENALRHGVAATSARSTIEIDADVRGDELRLGVSNDAPAAETRAGTAGRGVGLPNTRERLATLFGNRAGFTLTESAGRVRAEVRMPYRRSAASAPVLP
jgi:two-component system LytT family sensor kinase